MPKKSSKSSTGSKGKSSTGGTYHSSPMGKNGTASLSASDSNFVSVKNSTVYSSNPDDLEDTSATKDSKSRLFSINTGLPEDQPVITYVSEFLPIYESGQFSDTGKSLNVKENAAIVTSKNAITLLLQSPTAVPAVTSTKKDLSAFISSENDFYKNMLSYLSQVLRDLNVRHKLSYKDASFNIPQSLAFAYALRHISAAETLGDILISKSYSSLQVNSYSQSKIWQQILLELKKDIRSISSLTQAVETEDSYKKPAEKYSKDSIESTNYGAKNSSVSNDPYAISGINEISGAGVRPWINTDLSRVPSESRILAVAAESDIADLLSDMGPVVENLYVDLETGQTFGNLMTYSSEITDVSEISCLANIIQREKNYSEIINENIDKITEDFGYTYSSLGQNTAIFDYLIGKFSTSVTDIPTLHTGNGKALSSLSYHTENVPDNSGDIYKVLTFENTLLQDYPDITPGSFYFVDSTLNTPDGQNFDTSRINTLSSKVKSSLDSLDIVSKFAKVTDPSVMLTKLNSLFDPLVSVYKKCLLIKQGSKFVSGIDYSGIMPANKEESQFRRSAAFAKFLNSEGYFASGLDSNQEHNLRRVVKILIFCVLMNVVVLKSEGKSDISKNSAISVLKEKILYYLKKYKIDLTQSETNQINNEGRYASTSGDTLIGNVNTGAAFDENSGVWKIISDTMGQLYNSIPSYNLTEERTSYSGIDKIVYLYAYFDLLLKVVSSIAIESYAGAQLIAGFQGGKKIEEGSFIFSRIDSSELERSYKVYNGKAHEVKISKAKDLLTVHQLDLMRNFNAVRSFLISLRTSINNLKGVMEKDFSEHILRVSSLYATDTNINTQKQRDALLNLSLSQEQVILSQYVMSEMIDRINDQDASESILMSFPQFSDFPDKFADFSPLDSLDMSSYSSLRSFFNSPSFGNKEGNNKRIFGIGVPPRLMRSLRTTDSTLSSIESIKRNVVRIKLYRIDRFNPEIIYLPKTYLFEMNRFPTRQISNWSPDVLMSETINLLEIPTKYYNPSNQFEVHPDYSQAYINYGNFLSEGERLQIYSNHSISFLVEEYMQWFTDCKFGEAAYHRFYNLARDLKHIEDQYSAYLDSISLKKNSNVATAPSETTAFFTDANTGQSYSVPVTSRYNSAIKDAIKSDKKVTRHNIEMTQTVRSYFANKTFMMLNSDIKRYITYPRKFDRTFSIIVDPDDFSVDTSSTSSKDLQKAYDKGIIRKVSSKPGVAEYYAHRDTTPDDISFDDFFATIEPYDLSS